MGIDWVNSIATHDALAEKIDAYGRNSDQESIHIVSRLTKASPT